MTRESVCWSGGRVVGVDRYGRGTESVTIIRDESRKVMWEEGMNVGMSEVSVIRGVAVNGVVIGGLHDRKGEDNEGKDSGNSHAW